VAHVGKIGRPRVVQNIVNQSRLVILAELVEREVPVDLLRAILKRVIFAEPVSSRVSDPHVEAQVCEVERH